MRILKAAASGFASTAPIGVALMTAAALVAGREGALWIEGWAVVAACALVAVAAHVFMALRAHESLAVRQQGPVAAKAKRQPWWDIAALAVFLAYLIAFFAFIPLDVFRLHLAPPPTPAVTALGGLMILAGLTISHLAVIQNRFAAPTIHDQSATGQQVVDQGLYGHIRHPLYAGNLVTFAGMCLWLGSYPALIGVAGILIFTVIRIGMEEGYLRAHLPAYAGYAARVRSRLVPGVY